MIPGLGRERLYPLLYSGLESSMDCIVSGLAKSQTQLVTFTHSLSHFCLASVFKLNSMNFSLGNTILHNLAFLQSVFFKHSIIVSLSIELFGSSEQVV